MKYPKMQTLWKRNEKGRIIEGQYSKDEFPNIRRWLVTEKIDGTNIRVLLRDDTVEFGGRNHLQKSMKTIPKFLLDVLEELFTVEKLRKIFPDGNFTLFGEGYGGKIQKGGGLYRDDVSFILFDVVAHDILRDWWLKREDIEEIATKLNIDIVPILPMHSEEMIIEYVRFKPLSTTANHTKIIEGVIATADPPMLFRDGKPIKFKLKCIDFKEENK